MSNGTIIQQGKFTSDGNGGTITLRTDVDWFELVNYTQKGSAGGGQVISSYWQRGMADDTGTVNLKTAATNATEENVYAAGGFTYIDTSLQTPGALVATITDVSGANPPVVTNGGVNALLAGDMVRLVNVVGATQLNGVDFTVGNSTLSNTTFSLDYMGAIIAAAGITGGWRKIDYDPIFYPRSRTISKVTVGATTEIFFTVTHGYLVDQVVSFRVDTAFGMSQLNGLKGMILSVNAATNSITVDINSAAFTAFAWPLTGTGAVTRPHAVPVGEGSTGVAAGKFDDAKRNTAYIGISFPGGAAYPGGAANDVMYWKAGKSLSIDNQ